MDIKSRSQAQLLKAGGQAWLLHVSRTTAFRDFVWHPSKTTSKLPVMKHHINIVSLQILEITPRGGLTQQRSRAHVWSRGARRQGLDSMSTPGWEHPPSTARFLNSHLETETAALGTQETSFTPAGRKCFTAQAGSAWQPLASAASRAGLWAEKAISRLCSINRARMALGSVALVGLEGLARGGPHPSASPQSLGGEGSYPPWLI